LAGDKFIPFVYKCFRNLFWDINLQFRENSCWNDDLFIPVSRVGYEGTDLKTWYGGLNM